MNAQGTEGIHPGIRMRGLISEFGGPWDKGVSETEGLGLYERSQIAQRPDLFFAVGTVVRRNDEVVEITERTGLARRLNIGALYCAMRWDYKITPKELLRKSLVRITVNGRTLAAAPVDEGPGEMQRLIDASPAVLAALRVGTDTEVEVILICPS